MKAVIAQIDLTIAGMSCTSCEMRIEKALDPLDGVIEAKAAYNTSTVKVAFDENRIKPAKIIKSIENLGYQVNYQSGRRGTLINLNEKFKDDKLSINQILGIGIMLYALYLIIDNTIGFNFIPQVDQSMSYGILFMVGILTSLHCVSMCGGINLSQCVAHDTENNRADGLARLKPSFWYNLGRVISYTIIGGIAGALGSAVSFSGTARGVVAIAAGIFMIIMGANMLNLFPWLRKLNPRLPKSLSNRINKKSGTGKPLIVGLLNGLMPCGPLQAMQLCALAAGSFAAGALSMLMFALGTVPLMFGLGALSSLLSARFTRRLMQVSAILVIFLGVIMLNRGLNLGGFNALAIGSPEISQSAVAANVAQISGNVQTITTTMDSGRYTPIIVQKGIPVKWTIKAQAQDLNGCNNPISIPQYKIEKRLVPGDNLIEFTPAEAGSIIYTCWMGMISSNIKVVADLSEVSAQDIQTANAVAANTSRPSCCRPRPAAGN
ncbi:MAG: sulfite exporter TauE/SafE family protein [Syntrophomonadaceae bacterium]|nr:sulfite exporter TauE/SafE family protein [Syntrophomonadaceae bacterium]